MLSSGQANRSISVFNSSIYCPEKSHWLVRLAVHRPTRRMTALSDYHDNIIGPEQSADSCPIV